MIDILGKKSPRSLHAIGKRMKNANARNPRSYKGLRRSFIDKDGTLDCNEFYNVNAMFLPPW